MSAPKKVLVARWTCGTCGLDWDTRTRAKTCCSCIDCGGVKEERHRSMCAQCRYTATIVESDLQIARATRNKEHAVAALAALKEQKP